MNDMKKIVAIGPESTGKSTLCQQLAEHYDTLWCPEFAREYLLANGVEYTYDDLLTIAKGQLAIEDKKAEAVMRKSVNLELSIDRGETTDVRSKTADENDASNAKSYSERFPSDNPQSTPPLLFIDTDMYIMKVWCEYVYHKCHPFILEQIATRKYDLYLLCNPDLAWEPDVLREYPDEASRVELYTIYKGLLLNQDIPFVEITGNYDERLNKAIIAVDSMLAR